MRNGHIHYGLFALLISLVPSAHAGYIVTTLGVAGPANWAILAMNNTSLTVGMNGPGTSVGNVGIATGGDLALNGSAGPEIQGNLYFEGNTNFGGSSGCTPGCQVTGSVFNNSALVAPAVTAAINAAATFAGLTAGDLGGLVAVSSTTNVNGNTTIHRSGAITVVDLTNFNLGNNQVLTLNGNAGDQFIINVTAGNFHTLQGKVVETGGVTADDVVINVSGTGTLHSSGGGNSAVINGILLAPSASIAWSPGLINGELIAGGSSIQIVSGAEVIQQIPPVPEPLYTSLILTGLLGAIAVVYRKRRVSPMVK